MDPDATHVLDNYYLAITLLITIAYQLIFFSIAWTFKFDKLVHFAGGTNFVLLAVITLAMSGNNNLARNIVASLFLMLWAARLSGFLFFRILKTGSDSRFDGMRDQFFRFLGFWVFQMLWVWTVSLPVTILNSPAVTSYPQPPFGTGRDIAGVVLYALGFVFEALADAQKYRFRAARAGDRAAICDVGLFRLSRHPNYFGEILVQFAIFMIAVSPAADTPGVPKGSGAYAALYASIVGAFLLTGLLLFLSGLPLQERPAARKRYENGWNWEGYREYLQKTSILLPMPQAVWTRLPVVVKRTVGMEWPMYVFDPEKHAEGKGAAAGAGEEERRAEEGREE